MIKNNGYEAVNKQPRNKGKFVCKEDDPMMTLSVRLPQSIMEWIESQAKVKGTNRTEVVREMIQQQMS